MSKPRTKYILVAVRWNLEGAENSNIHWVELMTKRRLNEFKCKYNSIAKIALPLITVDLTQLPFDEYVTVITDKKMIRAFKTLYEDNKVGNFDFVQYVLDYADSERGA